MAVDQAFVGDYYDLAGDVSRASYQSFNDRLRAWLAFLDENSSAAAVIASLAPSFDFGQWYATANATVGQMGGGNLSWSANRREKLGQVLALYRHFAATPDEALQFAFRFYHAGSKLDANLRKLNEELFDPLARDLIKEIERFSPAAEPPTTAPASNRIVRLDDNYAAAQELRSQLATVEAAVERNNELSEDLDARDQALAELRAGKALIQAARVRVSAIAETLLPSLKWIGEKAAGNVIGIAVGAILALIAQLFGLHIMKP